jgi:hypothetical protein
LHSPIDGCVGLPWYRNANSPASHAISQGVIRSKMLTVQKKIKKLPAVIPAQAGMTG